MANANTPRATTQARDAKIILGIAKRLQNVSPIVLGGVSYTAATLTTLFQSAIDSANTVTATHGQWTSAVQADRLVAAHVRAVTTGLQEFVRQMFNNDPQALADFGFAAKKAAATTVAKKVVAVALREATRVARHTTGSKARLEITGVLTGPVVIPAGPAAAGQPATTAAAAPHAATPIAPTGASAAGGGETNGQPSGPKPPTAA